MDKISVIIPIYNTEAILGKCLQSVCDQTWPELEIICVDDGSTDGSGRIADQFAGRDVRFKVIHQRNSGESHARNVGLQASTGAYIAFIDCDDWIEPDMYATLMGHMDDREVDYVACGFYLDTDQESRSAESRLPISMEVFGRRELFHYLYCRDSYKAFTAWIWCKLYRRELLRVNERWISFDEDLRLGGDVLFALKAASQVQKAYYEPRAFYHYYQRETSAIHNRTDLSAWLGFLQAYERGIVHLRTNRIEMQAIPWLERFRAYWAYLIAGYAYEQKNQLILQQCQQVMRQHRNQYIALNGEYSERISAFQEVLARKLTEEAK